MSCHAYYSPKQKKLYESNDDYHRAFWLNAAGREVEVTEVIKATKTFIPSRWPDARYLGTVENLSKIIKY
jgi:hypothetical protein